MYKNINIYLGSKFLYLLTAKYLGNYMNNNYNINPIRMCFVYNFKLFVFKFLKSMDISSNLLSSY